MQITFFSNYMNHHQEEFSKQLYELTNGDYSFVACRKVEKERLKMKYEDMNNKYGFIVRPFESKEQKKKAKELAQNSDIVIFGSGDEKYFRLRMKTGKPTFRYAERLLKKGLFMRFFPPKVYRTYTRFSKYKNYDNFYVLCSSAYTAYDLSLFGFPTEKCYKWGYFPKLKKYDIENLISKKERNSILWAGRMIDWKHPEVLVLMAERLKNEGIDFQMHVIGNGKMENKIKAMVKRKKLDDKVMLHGALSPEEVREYMEKSEIYLFTSDFKEGWGAVLNEAMNSGCACVSSHAVGSAPFLIHNGENGFLYENANAEDLYNKVKLLLNDDAKRREISVNAYKTMDKVWNEKNAAKCIIELSEGIVNGKKDGVSNVGICSRASVLINDWYNEKNIKRDEPEN